MFWAVLNLKTVISRQKDKVWQCCDRQIPAKSLLVSGLSRDRKIPLPLPSPLPTFLSTRYVIVQSHNLARGKEAGRKRWIKFKSFPHCKSERASERSRFSKN
jgi:hypothetical protein